MDHFKKALKYSIVHEYVVIKDFKNRILYSSKAKTPTCSNFSMEHHTIKRILWSFIYYQTLQHWKPNDKYINMWHPINKNIFIHHHHYQVTLTVRVYQTLSTNTSLPYILPGSSLKLHPELARSWSKFLWFGQHRHVYV